jgi:hypothetical protein
MAKELSKTEWPSDRAVVEHLTHNSKIEGLNPAADIRRERKFQKEI